MRKVNMEVISFESTTLCTWNIFVLRIKLYTPYFNYSSIIVLEITMLIMYVLYILSKLRSMLLVQK